MAEDGIQSKANENKNKTKQHPPVFTKRYLKFEFIAGFTKPKDQNAKNKKQIQHIFSNGKNSFTLEGYRANVSVQFQSGNSLPECECSIYNVPEVITNQLSTLGQYQKDISSYGNYLVIYASSSINNDGQPVYEKIFEGGITVAYTDYGSAPDIVFHVRGMSMAGLNLISAKSISFKGKASVESILQNILDNYNNLLPVKNNEHLQLKLKNCGVKATLNKSNYSGDVIEQIRQCTNDANIRFNVQNGIVYIWPMDKSINEGAAMSISNKRIFNETRKMSVASGMIGYPAYANEGITVRSIFNGGIVFGEEIEVISGYKPTCGVWKYMISMQYDLSCFTPNGSWFTTIGLSNNNPSEKNKKH